MSWKSTLEFLVSGIICGRGGLVLEALVEEEAAFWSFRLNHYGVLRGRSKAQKDLPHKGYTDVPH